VTAVGDGWGRIDTPVSGATDVPSPLVINPTVSTVALPGQPTAVSTTVEFHHAPVVNALVSAAIQLAGTKTWTPVGQVRTNSSGVAQLSVPAQTADFTWKLSVAGDGKLQLASTSTGSVGIASKAIATATATLVVASGSVNTVTGTITFRGAPTAAPIQVLIKPATGTIWSTIATSSANAQGHFTVTIPAQATNYTWRVVVPTDGFTRLATSVSGLTSVQIGVVAHAVTTAAVQGVPAVKVGTKPTFVGATTPRLAGIKVLLRVYTNNAWTNVSTGTTNAKGIFTLVGTPQVTGRVRYQVIASPATGQQNVRGSTIVLSVMSK
jgi:hypothetical protein